MGRGRGRKLWQMLVQQVRLVVWEQQGGETGTEQVEYVWLTAKLGHVGREWGQEMIVLGLRAQLHTGQLVRHTGGRMGLRPPVLNAFKVN